MTEKQMCYKDMEKITGDGAGKRTSAQRLSNFI